MRVCEWHPTLPSTSSLARKEAVLSSQIEGTQSSLSDLLLFENDAAPGVPVDDARETLNYIEAMNSADLSAGPGRCRLADRYVSATAAAAISPPANGVTTRYIA